MPRRGENIHKRKDGRWEGRYNTGKSVTGKQTYISVYGKTYTEAKKKLFELSKEKDRSSETKRFMTLSEVINEWKGQNRLNRTITTEAKYDYMIKTHILPVMGNINIKSITTEYLNSFVEEKMKSGRIDKTGGLSASYVRTIMIILSSVINYAVEEQYCKPLKGKIHKPGIEKSRVNALSISEQKTLESHLYGNDSLTSFGILISLYMGLRIGEICALSWDNIDFENNLIRVVGTVIRTKSTNEAKTSTHLIITKPKTKASDRFIPIPSNLLPLFREHYHNRKSKFVLSENDTFLNPRTYEYRYHSLLKQSGVPNINYHALRHTFATRCIEAGVDVKTLSELLGHADVSITLNTYVHSSMDLKRMQIEKLCTISGQ